MDKMTRNFRLFHLIGLGIFIFVVVKMELSEFARIWNDANAYFILLGGLSVIVLHIIHAIKWKYILQCLSVSVPLTESIMISWIGMFIGMVTPGKIGDLLKIYFLGETKHSRIRTLLSVILDRFTDIFVLALVGIISAFVVFRWKVSLRQSIFIFVSIGIIIILAIQYKKNLFHLIQIFLLRYAPILFRQLQKIDSIRIFTEWKQINKRDAVFTFLLLIIAWSIYFFGRFLLLMSLSIPLSFFNMTACVSLSTLFTLLPVSFNGLGTREVSMIYLFSFYGLTMEQAVAFSMITLITEMFIVSFGYIPYCRLCSRFKFNIKKDAVRIKESFLGRA